MPVETKRKVTCYSAGEGGFMRRTQALREHWTKPLLALLARRAVTANQLTFASLVTGLAFCPIFLWYSQAAAFGLLMAHIILDGLDGPLARFTNRASNQGSFTDTMADQVVVVFSTVTMIHAGYANIWPGSLYLFFYSMVVIFAMIRNALEIPYSWLFRPRFFVYGWFVIEVYFWRGSLNVVLWLLTLLLAAKMYTGFIRIRRKL